MVTRIGVPIGGSFTPFVSFNGGRGEGGIGKDVSQAAEKGGVAAVAGMGRARCPRWRNSFVTAGEAASACLRPLSPEPAPLP